LRLSAHAQCGFVLIFLPPLLAQFTSDTFIITKAEFNAKKRELLGRM
jgi:hypothetical protein